MPEETEVPTEHLHESIEKELERTEERWILRVALSAALLAVFTAIASLFAGHHANEAVLEQIQASDQWSHYQAKGIKSMLLQSKVNLLKALDKPIDEEDEKKLAQYSEDQKDIEEKAREAEESSHRSFAIHNTLAKSVTVFQISIALCAIAALTKRKPLWYVSLLFGGGGIGLLILAFWPKYT